MSLILVMLAFAAAMISLSFGLFVDELDATPEQLIELLFEIPLTSAIIVWLVLFYYWELLVAVVLVDALVISLPNSLGLSTNLELMEVSLPFLFSLLCMI